MGAHGEGKPRAAAGGLSNITDGCCDGDRCKEVCSQSIVSGGDAAEVLEPAEHALNGVAVPVEVWREAVLVLPVAFGGMLAKVPRSLT